MSTDSAGRGRDGYGWFTGDLADDIPTQLVPAARELSAQSWAAPTPELLARLLEALKNDLQMDEEDLPCPVTALPEGSAHMRTKHVMFAHPSWTAKNDAVRRAVRIDEPVWFATGRPGTTGTDLQLNRARGDSVEPRFDLFEPAERTDDRRDLRLPQRQAVLDHWMGRGGRSTPALMLMVRR